MVYNNRFRVWLHRVPFGACNSYQTRLIPRSLDNLPKIDRMIAICLEKYPIERLSYVDRNLIRIGTYELMFTDTPVAIIINEIVNLSKEYTQIDNFESSKFNNALLDNISKRARK